MEILYSRALAHFVAAFDHGNLRRAASDVGVTQPAISKSIQKLEENIGTKLFERTSEGVRPTIIAHTLRRHAQSILNEARFVETEISSLVEGRTGLVRIGVGPAWSLTVFPAILEKFRTRFPQIDVEVESGVTDHLLPRLEDGDIDIWLGSLHSIKDSDEVITCAGGQAELRVYARPSHPLVKLKNVSAHDMNSFSWATFVNDKRGLEYLGRYFSESGLARPRVALRLSSLMTMFRIAMESDLLVLAADSLEDEATARGLTMLRHDGCIWRFSVGMAYRRNTAHLAVTKFFIASMEGI